MNAILSGPDRLLQPDEPAAVEVVNPGGRSPYVLLCEHASNAVPRRLGNLGLTEEDLNRHIAFDRGARHLAMALAAQLDAPLVLQGYSRLVCDCNRAEGDADFIVGTSDGTVVPGNANLATADRRRRIEEIFRPFHDAVTGMLDRRALLGLPTSIVAVHSFTPVFAGHARPWHAGVLYVERSTLVERLLGTLREDASLAIGDNEPYSLLVTYSESMTRHGLRRGLPALEIEVRQDLLASAAACDGWAARIARALPQPG